MQPTMLFLGQATNYAKNNRKGTDRTWSVAVAVLRKRSDVEIKTTKVSWTASYHEI